MDNDEHESPLENALEIDSDYVRLPSEIAERITKIQSEYEGADGKEYEIARDNILSLMKIGGEALSDVSSIAAQTSHPRMFEVFTELMKTMIQANRELMEVKRMDDKSRQDDKQNGKVIDGEATDVMINCTPGQLIDMMKKVKKDG